MMVILAALGMLRISLAVSAAEAAIDSQRLERSIKEEALRAKGLEADRSALGAPSRIAAIAGCTLEMTESGQISYICLPTTDDAAGAGDSGTAVAAAGSKAAAGGTATAVKSVIASVLDIAAGEAQVLLVGDVGLSSTR